MNFSGQFEMQGMLFVVMPLGCFLRKKGILAEWGKELLTDLLLYVTLPASIIAVMATKYGSNEIFATKCVAFSTLLSMVTAPIWCMILT